MRPLSSHARCTENTQVLWQFRLSWHRPLAMKSSLPRFIFHLTSNSHHPFLRGKDDGRCNTTVEANISRSATPTALQHCATTNLLRNDNGTASDHHAALFPTTTTTQLWFYFVFTPPTLLHHSRRACTLQPPPLTTPIRLPSNNLTPYPWRSSNTTGGNRPAQQNTLDTTHPRQRYFHRVKGGYRRPLGRSLH